MKSRGQNEVAAQIHSWRARCLKSSQNPGPGAITTKFSSRAVRTDGRTNLVVVFRISLPLKVVQIAYDQISDFIVLRIGAKIF